MAVCVWLSSWTSVFLWSKCARLDWIHPIPGSATYNTSQTSRYLSLCASSGCTLPFIYLVQRLSPPFTISDYKCSGGTSCSTLPPFLSASMTHFSYALASALNFSCFAPSSLSVYHVFLALLFFSSLNLYWLPSHLLLLYSIFLSPSPSVFCLLASRAPGLKHAVIHWIGSCVQV